MTMHPDTRAPIRLHRERLAAHVTAATPRPRAVRRSLAAAVLDTALRRTAAAAALALALGLAALLLHAVLR